MNTRQINIDGLDLISSDYNFVLEGLFNFDKDIKSNDLYTDGDSFNSSKLKSKKLLLNGFVKSFDINKILQLNRILAPNKLKVLTVDIIELGVITCNIEIQNRSTGNNSRIISCQFTMPDPYLYSSESISLPLGAISNSGLTFPMTFPIQFGAITGGQGTMTNVGNVDAYPVITVVGNCSDINIENTTTGESMSCNISLLESDILIIDCRPSTRSILLNGVKRIDLKDGQWIKCIPGDNEFIFTRNSLETKQHCIVSLKSRWI